MITASHINKTYTAPDGATFQALNDISFSIDQGEFVGIIGPSGAGKTTLLRTLNLFDPPTSGSIVIDGQEVTAPGYPVDRLRQKVGYVFQQCNLFPHLTLMGNITLALTKVQHLPESEARTRALDALNKVSLAEKASAFPSTLSGGQQQRAAIARTLALQPKILLLDEPTSALDPTMVSEITGVMRLLAKEGLTMILVTHKMRLARDLAQRILFLDRGTLIEDCPANRIFQQPENPVVRAYIQRIRTLEFNVTSRQFDFYDMMSQIRQFCIRQAIPEKMDPITHIVEEMLLLLGNYHSPVHIEVTHSELDGVAKVVIVHQGESVSPLERPDADELAVMIIRGMSSHIDTDTTPDGIRLTFSI